MTTEILAQAPAKHAQGKHPNTIANLKRGKQEGPGPALEIADKDVTLFEDMQHVRRFPKKEDRTQGHKDARKWKDRDLKGFMLRYAELEARAADQQEQKTATGQSVADEDAEDLMPEEWEAIKAASKIKVAVDALTKATRAATKFLEQHDGRAAEGVEGEPAVPSVGPLGGEQPASCGPETNPALPG